MSPFGSPKDTPPSSSPLRTPSPRVPVDTSSSLKNSSSDSTPPQVGSPLTVVKEKDEECCQVKTKNVAIKRRNSRRKLTGVDVSPDYAAFRDRTKEDALTRKLSLPRKAPVEVAGRPMLKEISDKMSTGRTSPALKSICASMDSCKRRRSTSQTTIDGNSLQDVELTGFQTTPRLPQGKVEKLTEKTVGLNRVQSSPALLSEVVRRLPLQLKTEAEPSSQSFSDFIRQIATEGLATTPLTKLSSPIFRVSDQVDSPLSDFGGSTPPNLFQISPHSWSELAELAVARERKISLSKRSVSRTPSDTSERSERKSSEQDINKEKQFTPNVTTCKGSKVTLGFEESSRNVRSSRTKADGLAPQFGIDTHIGTVFLQPPDLPEETLMPSEHLKVMELIESKNVYVDSIVQISEETENLWSETHELFVRFSRDSKRKKLQALMPTGEVCLLQKIALLSEAMKILLRIIEFSQQELEAGNLRPTKAMKDSKLRSSISHFVSMINILFICTSQFTTL